VQFSKNSFEIGIKLTLTPKMTVALIFPNRNAIMNVHVLNRNH